MTVTVGTTLIGSNATAFTTVMPSTATWTTGNLTFTIPANGLYIDHVRLFVLEQVLRLQSELMTDLLERRNAQHQR